MDELVKTFHIDWKLLIAQIINFAIVLGVLWYFAVKPLSKVMNKRTEDIAKSLKNAEEIEKKLKETAVTKENIITEAKKEAQIIVEKSYQEAAKAREQKISETKKEVAGIVSKTKAELAAEKDKIVREAKAEVAGLVVKAASEIVGKNMDDESNRRLIEETIKQVK